MRTRVPRQRPLAVFDLDGTLVREQLLVMLTKKCLELEIFRAVFDELFREVRLKHRDRKITFEEYDREIIKLFSDRIKGKLRSDVNLAAKKVFEKNRDWLYVFTRALLGELRKSHETVIITGAMHEVVEPLAPYWGFEHFYATELEVNEDGRYTGADKSVPVFNKGKCLREHVQRRVDSAATPKVADGIRNSMLQGSVAIGDTGSDVSMLAEVDHPIAFNPNGVLHEEAARRGWPVVLERKDGIYVLNGETVKRFRSYDESETHQAVKYVLSLSKPRHR